ncbi:MAG: MAPEG family protein [Pseudomonadota bacterium]
MLFTVTPIYALATSAIQLTLWFRVSAARSAAGVSFGDGGDPALLRRVRQHGNCAEWTAFVLILMILAEGMDASAVWLHASGALLLVGRLAHPFGLKPDDAGHPMRYLGNGANLLAALAALACIALRLLDI